MNARAPIPNRLVKAANGSKAGSLSLWDIWRASRPFLGGLGAAVVGSVVIYVTGYDFGSEFVNGMVASGVALAGAYLTDIFNKWREDTTQ